MQFFIDHKYRRIHQRQFAGDRCGFVETPVEEREFTDSEDYIGQLENRELYEVCPHCQSAPTVIR